MDFVGDASATMPWVLEDETTAWSESLLERVKSGDDHLIVPAHWPVELSNAMLMAQRRKRMVPGRALLFWDQLSHLAIQVAAPLTPSQAKEVYLLAERHGLTVYDAAYLELAQRNSLPLASLDSALIRAATRDGLALVS